MERLVISSDCGMGREGMSRRHAFYKTVALQGSNMCLVADPRYSLVVQAT